MLRCFITVQPVTDLTTITIQLCSSLPESWSCIQTDSTHHWAPSAMELCHLVVVSKSEHRPTIASTLGGTLVGSQSFFTNILSTPMSPCQSDPCSIVQSTPSPHACLGKNICGIEVHPNQLVCRVQVHMPPPHHPPPPWRRRNARQGWRTVAYKLALYGLFSCQVCILYFTSVRHNYFFLRFNSGDKGYFNPRTQFGSCHNANSTIFLSIGPQQFLHVSGYISFDNSQYFLCQAFKKGLRVSHYHFILLIVGNSSFGKMPCRIVCEVSSGLLI